MSITDSEFQIMELIWANGGTLQASEIAMTLNKSQAISVSTVYTLIARLIKKGVISRIDPGFYCVSKIKKEDESKKAVSQVIEKYFDKSAYDLICHCLNEGLLSENDIIRLKKNLTNK